MDIEKIDYLKEKAIELREVLLSVVYKVEFGNTASCLGLADIMTALYFNFLIIDSKNPSLYERDRFILSRPNTLPLQYAALYLLGFLDKTNLYSLGQLKHRNNNILNNDKLAGIDISNVANGQGVSQGVGMALSLKRDKQSSKVYVIVGDNECSEGQVWEALNTASKYCLDNLILIIDNSTQFDTTTHDIHENKNLREKLKAFGFETQQIDGNDIAQIVNSLDFMLLQKNGKPKCLICDNIKGKGVSFMENVPTWNYTVPTKDQFEKAMNELRGNI